MVCKWCLRKHIQHENIGVATKRRKSERRKIQNIEKSKHRMSQNVESQNVEKT